MSAPNSNVPNDTRQPTQVQTADGNIADHNSTVSGWFVRPCNNSSLLRSKIAIEDNPTMVYGVNNEGRRTAEYYNTQCLRLIRNSAARDKEAHGNLWDPQRIIEDAKPLVDKWTSPENVDLSFNRSIYLTHEDSKGHMVRFNEAKESCTCRNGIIVPATDASLAKWTKGLVSEHRMMLFLDFIPSDVKVYIPPDCTVIHNDGTRSINHCTESEDQRTSTVSEIYGKIMNQKTANGELPSSKVIEGIMRPYTERGYGALSLGTEVVSQLPCLQRPV
ncbi:hypothetical protein I302_100893 [Kwoniella bestiolae CBS 10118]|uniref:Uncharacterized protein n=1 Tax=Kwoniella bestiolae CBS 10118 TaxID=1296100 RepID=A0A1B9G6F3_9TREE|nr:hypothetical protein I302_04267 [Kwoniella bestiolae CBS 10118]OCF26581.1 hypothetical protein I302_04267 [Kwoniella bestiolae CBS 10118]